MDENKRKKEMINSLNKIGLITSEERSDDKKRSFVLITATEKTLKKYAEIIELPMKLREKYGGGYVPYKREKKMLNDQNKLSYDEEQIVLNMDNNVGYNSFSEQPLIIEDDNYQITDNKKIKWDFCLIFENKDEKYMDMDENKRKKEMINSLNKIGLITSEERSDDKKRSFVLITATEKTLKKYAEIIELPMKLREKYGGGYVPYKREYDEIFVPVNSYRPQKLFFTTLQRIRIIQYMIEEKVVLGGAGITIFHEVQKKRLLGGFALHNPDTVEWLMQNWVRGRTSQFKNIYDLKSNFNLPPFVPSMHEQVKEDRDYDKYRLIDAVKDYFGEEIGLYFSFTEFYARWLIAASIVGVIALLIELIFFKQQLDTWPSAAYAIFLALWATWFLEFWKRKNSALNHEWGTEMFEESEKTRPEYQGVEVKGIWYDGEFIQIDDHDVEPFHEKTPITIYSDLNSKRRKMIIALMPIFLFVFGCIILTIALLTVRMLLQQKTFLGATFGGGAGSAVLAINIQILNQVYNLLAVKLNDMENHHTVTSYNDNLVIKTFLFQFVNSYTSFYYIAFFKQGYYIKGSDGKYSPVGGLKLWGDGKLVDTCQSDIPRKYGCMPELTTNVLVVLLVNMFASQIAEQLLPKVFRYLCIWWRKKDVKDLLVVDGRLKDKPWEVQADMLPNINTFDDYNELVIQYGYITLFASSLPVAPILALINNIVEIKTDGYKYLKSLQRPLYRGAEDIGVWYWVLEILGVMAVITNAFLIGFSTRIFDHYDVITILVFVIIFENTVIASKFFVSFAVPDVPGNIKRAMGKELYLKGLISSIFEKKKNK
eukprot:TRINITY_DN339_c0_g1_i4.p1 TRINITY_DN339_c0_g1~~TRINITY_DN339_c0_g1_i4.p1  ORF type:complete len:898 (+),score=254.62 TRINITY_DN339_c0_g1_i4:225-2696(+)